MIGLVQSSQFTPLLKQQRHVTGGKNFSGREKSPSGRAFAGSWFRRLPRRGNQCKGPWLTLFPQNSSPRYLLQAVFFLYITLPRFWIQMSFRRFSPLSPPPQVTGVQLVITVHCETPFVLKNTETRRRNWFRHDPKRKVNFDLLRFQPAVLFGPLPTLYPLSLYPPIPSLLPSPLTLLPFPLSLFISIAPLLAPSSPLSPSPRLSAPVLL